MADRTESSIVIASTPDVIMDVIADLEIYPEWSDGVKEVVVLTEYEDGRPAEARFRLESGPIKDTYELEYEWHGVRSVSWTLTQGQVLKGMDGTYALHDNGCAVLDDALGWFTCDAREFHTTGDHTIVVGLVTDGDVVRPGEMLIERDLGWEYAG